MEILAAGPAGVRRAAALVRAGAVVGFPTDTVYGLAAGAGDGAAIDRVFEIKARPRERALVLMVAEVAQLAGWVEIDRRARRFMEAWWPGPLTLVLPALPAAVPPLAAQTGTLAVRIPNQALALDLLRALEDGIATTSANRSHEPPALRADQLGGLTGVAAVLDGGPAPGGLPSTVLDLTTPIPRVLREGPIPSEALLKDPG